MNLFIVFMIGLFVLSIGWRENAGNSRPKRLIPLILIVTFAYYFLNMI